MFQTDVRRIENEYMRDLRKYGNLNNIKTLFVQIIKIIKFIL